VWNPDTQHTCPCEGILWGRLEGDAARQALGTPASILGAARQKQVIADKKLCLKFQLKHLLLFLMNNA
jgi:hypothetical protein